MNISLADENLLGFLSEIQENASLRMLFEESKYWTKGGRQAINLLLNSQMSTVPDEVEDAVVNLLTDVCPEQCDAGCTIEWNDMSAVLLNGDGLCLPHHNQKHKIDNE